MIEPTASSKSSPMLSRTVLATSLSVLFAATAEGANASANLYSLVETAKANDLEPSAYLKTIFTLLPQAKTVEDIEALLPWNINAKNRQ